MNHKKIFFPVKLPLWTVWTAVDGFGVLMAFSKKPAVNGQYWAATGGRKKDILQFHNQSYRGWRNTLCEINPVTNPGS